MESDNQVTHPNHFLTVFLFSKCHTGIPACAASQLCIYAMKLRHPLHQSLVIMADNLQSFAHLFHNDTVHCMKRLCFKFCIVNIFVVKLEIISKIGDLNTAVEDHVPQYLLFFF